MRYCIEITQSARRDVLALDDTSFRRIAKAIDGLQENPRPRGSRKLRGKEETWRLRVGDFRLLYTVNDRTGQVIVYRVKHRREAYR